MILLAFLFMYQVTDAQLGNINGRRIVDFNENMRCKREDASTAFGYKIFNFKLKKNQGIIKKLRKENNCWMNHFQVARIVLIHGAMLKFQYHCY